MAVKDSCCPGLSEIGEVMQWSEALKTRSASRRIDPTNRRSETKRLKGAQERIDVKRPTGAPAPDKQRRKGSVVKSESSRLTLDT